MERMLLVLKRESAAESALQELLARQQDKSSSAFHAWLSPEQFADRFDFKNRTCKRLTAWLQSITRFRVNRIARGGMGIEFSGTATQVKEAFHTPIHSYTVGAINHYANASDPQIPAAFAAVVAGVSTLHDFHKRAPVHALGAATRIKNTSAWQPSFTFNGAAGVFHYLSPGDFSKIFNTAALYKAGIDGTGQSIAIVGRNNINLSDIQIFRIAFGLPPNDPTVILDGPDPGNALGSGEETEADLDVEWSGAIAPNAKINFVVSASTNTTDGADLSAQYIVDNNISPILSMSFGLCEAALGPAQNTFYNNLWAQAAAQGITVVVSTGDNGPAGCDNPNFGAAKGGPAVSRACLTPSTSPWAARSSTKTARTANIGPPPTARINLPRSAISLKRSGMRVVRARINAASSTYSPAVEGPARSIATAKPSLGKQGPAFRLKPDNATFPDWCR